MPMRILYQLLPSKGKLKAGKKTDGGHIFLPKYQLL